MRQGKWQCASMWLRRLANPDAEVRRALEQTYGGDAFLYEERAALIVRTLQGFVARFGDSPVRVFRCPARINLRGMHIDTHGGYLNLMTHQRETVAVAAPTPEGSCAFTNIEPGFAEAQFSILPELHGKGWGLPWRSYITHPETQAAVAARKGSWENYLRGAVLRAQYEAGNEPLCGLCATIGSDIPRGAALSSSHALAASVLLAMLGANGLNLAPGALILAVQDAEWYTGARTGTSDQGAMILGGLNALVHAALYPDDLDLKDVARLTFPEDLRVLVIHSHTQRSLSGAALAAYTRNRFAYSQALEIFRQELKRRNRDVAFVNSLDRLSRITPETLGGDAAVYELLRRIPREMGLETLRARYELPAFEEAFTRYFGGLDEANRPRAVPLRGPLLFALAESERARRFYGLLERRDYEGAGRLMSLGHNGDRVVTREGEPFSRDVTDVMLDGYVRAGTPLAECPGDYGASSPALDALVDAALAGGALGASLTGAGIAGSVLALCRAQDEEAVSESARACLASSGYAGVAGHAAGLSGEALERAVVPNTAVAAAGELML